MAAFQRATTALEEASAEIQKLRDEKMRVVNAIAGHVQALKHPSLHPVARLAGEFILDDILSAMQI